MRHERGFTLIELLMTMAILVVMATLAGPPMASMIATQRLRGVATDFHQSLLKARSEAIKRNTSVTVNPIGGSWAAGWSIVDPANPSGQPLEQRSSDGAVAVATSLTQIVYRGSGRIAATTTPTFVFSASSASESRCVAIDPSGRPYGTKGSTC
ncbi:MAG: GspH/FimT family pseudopilin [Proteobacteria bacterium]|nr:GspH/FimT family pseudopilin [Pseudomonadota bacterium]